MYQRVRTNVSAVNQNMPMASGNHFRNGCRYFGMCVAFFGTGVACFGMRVVSILFFYPTFAYNFKVHG